MTWLVVFAARLTPTTAVAGCFLCVFLFPCFLFSGTTELLTLTMDALALFIDFLYTAWPPPRCFPVFSCRALVFSRKPNGLFVFVVFQWFRFWFWVFVRFQVRSACNLAWFVSPPPPPFPPCAACLCCASCIFVLHATRRLVTCNGSGPFRPTTSRVRPHPPPAGRRRGDARGGGPVGWPGPLWPRATLGLWLLSRNPWRHPAPYETQPFRQCWVL